jgi:hypothetical protein
MILAFALSSRVRQEGKHWKSRKFGDEARGDCYLIYGFHYLANVEGLAKRLDDVVGSYGRAGGRGEAGVPRGLVMHDRDTNVRF